MAEIDMSPRQGALDRAMSENIQEIPAEAAPAQPSPEEVVIALEELRPLARDDAKFTQALQLLAESLGAGQTEEPNEAPTTADISEEETL